MTKYDQEENIEERIDPAYIDMLSEARSDSDSEQSKSAQKTSTAKKTKKVLDKWQMLADEREERLKKSPPRRFIDPNVPQVHLIEQMETEKRKRREREEYLKELARKKLEGDSDADEADDWLKFHLWLSA